MMFKKRKGAPEFIAVEEINKRFESGLFSSEAEMKAFGRDVLAREQKNVDERYKAGVILKSRKGFIDAAYITATQLVEQASTIRKIGSDAAAAVTDETAEHDDADDLLQLVVHIEGKLKAISASDASDIAVLL